MNAVAARSPGAIERHEVVALAAELARRELAPHALELDLRRPGALETAWGRVAEVGFDRALLAVEEGGVGLDAGSLLLCLEELAAGDGGVALLVLLANAALAALPAERAARIAEGERWAMVPAPPELLRTPARIAVGAGADGRPSLAGSLSPALGALAADGIVVVRGGTQPVLLALPSEAPGIELRECEPQLGLRSAAAARIVFDAATAEPAAGPAAAAAAEASLSLLRAGCAAIARGVARRAAAMALEYAQARTQGGVAIVEHDAVRRMLAAMSVRASATAAAPAGVLDEAATLTAKVAATEAALATCTDAVQVFGGTGYMHDTGVEKLMRDAKYLQLWPEPNWMADDRIVEAALGGG